MAGVTGTNTQTLQFHAVYIKMKWYVMAPVVSEVFAGISSALKMKRLIAQ